MAKLKQITTYHDENKTIIAEIYQIDEQGLRQGACKCFYENGNIMGKGTYKDDELEGAFKYYYENGSIMGKGTYKDDKWDGACKYYNENGNIEIEKIYKNGILIEVKTF
jgi:antitoxin component YwqK of YwqJK toxin-antitoxin module